MDYFKRMEQAQILINDALHKNDEVELTRLMLIVEEKTQMSNRFVYRYLKQKEKIGLIIIDGEIVKKVK
jgi:hypothetical protein